MRIINTYRAYLVDYGNACWTREHFAEEIQTRQYRAPEVILGIKYSTSVDMWSVGCLAFELLTGDLLFEPKDGDSYDKDDDHLAQMIEVLGRIPKKIRLERKIFQASFQQLWRIKIHPKIVNVGPGRGSRAKVQIRE